MTKFPHSYDVVRFSDCDMMGHLNNACYFDYLNHARMQHLRDNYGFDIAAYYRNGLSWVVTAHHIRYLRPALFGERVFIQSALLKAGEGSLEVEMLMMDEKKSELKALLWSTFVPVNLGTGRSGVHPPEFMEFARSVECADPDLSLGQDHRLATLLNSLN